MPGYFISPVGDLETIFVDDYNVIDQFATTGSLWMWGSNASGKIGDNTTTNRSSPVQTVSSGTNWKSVSAYYNYTAAIKTDGTLWVWGNNLNGNLGTNNFTNYSSPVQTISGGSNWAQVSTGLEAGAIKTDGTLWMWGSGTFGGNGDNTTTNRTSPVQTISGGNNWKQLSVGQWFTGAIKTDGTLWMWGLNDSGQVGIGNFTTNYSSPVQTTSGGTNWKQVSCGATHTAAIKTDGTLWLWGNGANGRLGDNSTTSRNSPVQTISGGTNWKQVSCGDITAAIKTDGTLWTWGINTRGALGDNTVASKSSPVQTISGGTNWKQVTAGQETVGAIKTDGTLWTWGQNTEGVLGDNTLTNKSSPVQTVAGGTNWKLVSTVSSTGQGIAGMGAIHFYDAGNLYPNA